MTCFFVLLLTACSLAPKMEVPKTDFPAAFKEEGADPGATWKQAEKLSAEDRGQWWKIFADKELDALQQQAAEGSQTLKIAAARVLQARAAAKAGEAGLFPNIGLGGNALRVKAAGAAPANDWQAAGAASWEPDFFSRLRDGARALALAADAQQAAYRDALLSLQADVARTYFALRVLDAERALLRKTIKIYAESARIMRAKRKAGEASEQDAARADAELDGARAQLTALDRARAGREHVLAVLLGRLPSSFAFKEKPLEETTPPRIPAGLPSTLLERRPDVVAAQDMMAAANENIGAARAAYFPNLVLTAAGGFDAATFAGLFHWSARTWALGQTAGLALSLPIFDGGRRGAQLDAARAKYDEALAAYRQQVLVAFRDVEDNLADQALLMTQSKQQDAAAASAGKVARFARKRFEAGESDYAEVADSARAALAARRAAVQTRGQRFIATVELVRSLGGGWGALEPSLRID